MKVKRVRLSKDKIEGKHRDTATPHFLRDEGPSRPLSDCEVL